MKNKSKKTSMLCGKLTITTNVEFESVSEAVNSLTDQQKQNNDIIELKTPSKKYVFLMTSEKDDNDTLLYCTKEF